MLPFIRRSAPEAVQIAGALALGVGLFLAFGVAIGLIAVGVLAIAAGVAMEVIR